jgi:hypothetical protein
MRLLIRLWDGRTTPKKKVDEKSGWQMIVSDQVSHEYLGNVPFQGKHRRSYRGKLIRSQRGRHISLCDPPAAVAVSPTRPFPVSTVFLTVPGVVGDLGDHGVTRVPLIGTLLSVKATLFGFELRWRLL